MSTRSSLSGMFTIMIGTQGIAAQWLYWAAAYLIYRLMLIAETGSDVLFIATLFLVLAAAIQRPLDMDAWEAAAEF
jgi:hypothetical protein